MIYGQNQTIWVENAVDNYNCLGRDCGQRVFPQKKNKNKKQKTRRGHL